ncbi:MAG: heme biosynthesis protein HemY [Burkholderiales bacterium]|nr:heme biosynthesis protein HemY [Burkholderiales bacterium]
MKGLFWFLAVATAAVAAALFARYQDGYVLVVVPPWRIDVSLTLALLVVIAAFAALHWLTHLAGTMLRMPANVAAYRRRQRHNRGVEALRAAWQAYFEGRFGKAEKLAGRAWGFDEAPGVAALLAARAAHQMRDPERRELWLARAESTADRNARLATRAELLLDERRFEEARATLAELAEHGPRHVATLRMRLRAEQGLQNWDEVLRLARQLEKRNAIAPEVAAQLRATAVVENLRRKALDAESLAAFWQGLPEADRLHPRIATAAARLFIRLGGCRQAHKIVREALESRWDSALALVYGECRADDSLERLSDAERWLAARPRDAALLLTLGRLCKQRELWGKARSYLEASLSEQPSRAAHIELARLADETGDAAAAAKHFRAAADEGLPAEPG